MPVSHARSIAAFCLLTGLGPWFLATQDMADGIHVEVWLQTGDFNYIRAAFMDGNWYLTPAIFLFCRFISEATGIAYFLVA